MNDIICMSVSKSICNVFGDMYRRRNIKWCFLLNLFLECSARNILHDDVVFFTVNANVIDIDDIWVRHACSRLGLTMEFFYEFGIILVSGVKYLDCYSAIQQIILRFIYFCHAAVADTLLKQISAAKSTLNH